MPESLDEIVLRKADELAQELRTLAPLVDNEAEIRIAVERRLAFLEHESGVKLEGRHEFTLARGRVDSIYSRVIIEYKNPNSPAARVGARSDSPGAKAVVDQIKRRFYDMRSQHGQPLNTLFGVGLDGRHVVFVRFRDDQWQVEDPVEVTRFSCERFLWALVNLGHSGRPFSPQYLAGDFGAESPLARGGVRALYEAIVAAEHPKAQTFFRQWRILFSEVCGYDVDSPSDKLKKLAAAYELPLRGLRPAELLFAVHTYYALFMKLLAAEIVAYFHKLPAPLKRMHSAPTSAKLRAELEELERGSIFRHIPITNFLEGDLFAWYTSVWSEGVERAVRGLVRKLDEYHPGSLSEDPATSRDLLKRLYQQLFPKSVRHDLGEYYTPDWLAEHVLDELGYEGDPDKRILDPACGSGTFLVAAINRVRRWYEAHRESVRYGENELARKLLTNVVGFDLNPLAVMAARTNYLVALRGLISHLGQVELPVYLCDSILTPAAYGGLFAGQKLGQARELKTAAATFLVPMDVAARREDLGRYAEQLELCVRNQYAPEEFLQRLRDEGLTVEDEKLHLRLFKELVKLDRANQNGVWARIIKNAFAPLFVGRVDYVAGNPPWVNWESLPEEYRDSTLDLWDRYRLRERTGGARLGNVKKELSALFVYACLDHYVADGGKLGFVITQSVFKTGANEGFRRFACADDRPFAVARVSDLSLLLPFEHAINRTAVVVAQAGRPTQYPVDYRLWVPKEPRSVVPEQDLELVRQRVRIEEWLATPVEPSARGSTWLTAPRRVLPTLQQIVGDRSPVVMDRTYAGSCIWLNGVYWVEAVQQQGRRTVIRNLADVGKKQVEHVTAAVDSEFVYPLLRGRDVQAWRAEPSALILVPHRKDAFREPVPLAEMKRRFPATFDFFKRFEEDLRGRSGYKQIHKGRPEFYVVGNVGNYTLAPYKVVFKELTEVFQCAVIGPGDAERRSSMPTIPDHKLLFIACDSEDEAYYLAGLLNSVPVRCALYSASVGVQTQSYYPTDVARIRLPTEEVSAATKRRITALSRRCHESAVSGDDEAVRTAERQLTECVGTVWGLAKTTVNRLNSYYDELLTFRGGGLSPNASEPE